MMSNTDIPSLPTGWESCCFGDIARIRNGYAFKSELFKKSREHETDVPLIRQSQMKGARIDTSDAVYLSGDHLKKHSDYVITKGDVIIGMSGSIGKVCLYAEDFPALQNQRTGKIVPHLVSELNPKFFGLFLSNIERELTEFAKGMGVQNISAKDIEQLPFNLPPKNEQHRIVAKIEELFSELDKGIENLKTAQAQLKVYRQALLKHAFEGKLTAQWREQNHDKLETAADLLKRIQQERAQRYQQQLSTWEASGGDSKPKAPKPLPPLTAEEQAELPERWCWEKLGNIADLVGGVTKGKDLNGKEKISLPYLRVANVQDGYLDLTEIKYIEVEQKDKDKYRLEFGDVLYTEGGDKDKLGRGAVWRSQIESCIHQNHIFRARVFGGVISPEILSLYSQTKSAKKYFFRHAKQTTNLASINLTVLANLPVAIFGQSEQKQILQEIEARLSEVDQLVQTITTSLQQAEALRQSILKRAFSGQLVPQDPHDEPASALLARIKAERDANKATAKPSRVKIHS